MSLTYKPFHTRRRLRRRVIDSSPVLDTRDTQPNATKCPAASTRPATIVDLTSSSQNVGISISGSLDEADNGGTEHEDELELDDELPYVIALAEAKITTDTQHSPALRQLHEGYISFAGHLCREARTDSTTIHIIFGLSKMARI